MGGTAIHGWLHCCTYGKYPFALGQKYQYSLRSVSVAGGGGMCCGTGTGAYVGLGGCV